MILSIYLYWWGKKQRGTLWEDLLAKEAHLRMLIRQANVVVWATDKDLKFTYSDGAALKGLHLRSNQVVEEGFSIIDFFSGQSREFPPIKSHIEALKGNPASYLTHWGGRDFQTEVTPLRDPSGEVVGCTGVAVDITELRKAEEDLRQSKALAESASQAKSEFLANISHEIRTPLAAIVGFADLLASPFGVKEEQAMYIERISKNAQHLQSLVSDILDLSKIEAGKMELSISRVDLGAELENVFSSYRRQSKQKGIEFMVQLGSELPKSIHTDPTRFRQVLENVVDNAVKFTDKGEVRVEVGLTPAKVDSNRSLLMFTVSDSGFGVAAEDQDKLFRSFEQVDGSLSRRYGGSGLGLALCKKLTQALGGDIWLKASELGKGSSFVFILGIDPISPQPNTKSPRQRHLCRPKVDSPNSEHASGH